MSSLRYDQVRQKSVHNCFGQREGVLDQIVYWRARSLEVDIHRDKRVSGKRIGVGRKKVPRGFPKLKGDWYIYHEEWDADSTVDQLSGFLALCAGIHDAMPKHEVFTLFLDAKDGFHTTSEAAQSWKKLDELLGRTLGKTNLFEPRDLMDWAGRIAAERGEREPASLRDAVGRFGWPTLEELKGKFIVALTGPSKRLESYATKAEALSRTSFLSAGLGADTRVPPRSHIVFFNMSAGNIKRAADVPQGCIARAYYVNDERKWAAAVKHGCHHIATDMVNAGKHAWARTEGPSGFPFEAIQGQAPDGPEEARVGAVWAWSDDLWEESDSFYFSFRECASGQVDNDYVFYVTGPNSYCEDWRKGGALARESLEPGAPYFGVFRHGQKAGLRVQYRTRPGKATMTEPLVDQPGFAADTLAFVRLALSKGGKTAAAHGSVDGSKWTFICSVDFDEPLRFQGIGVSAHEDPDGAKFLFGIPSGARQPSFDSKRLIGPHRNHRFKGGCDWDGEQRWKVRNFG